MIRKDKQWEDFVVRLRDGVAAALRSSVDCSQAATSHIFGSGLAYGAKFMVNPDFATGRPVHVRHAGMAQTALRYIVWFWAAVVRTVAQRSPASINAVRATLAKEVKELFETAIASLEMGVKLTAAQHEPVRAFIAMIQRGFWLTPFFMDLLYLVQMRKSLGIGVKRAEVIAWEVSRTFVDDGVQYNSDNPMDVQRLLHAQHGEEPVHVFACGRALWASSKRARVQKKSARKNLRRLLA